MSRAHSENTSESQIAEDTVAAVSDNVSNEEANTSSKRKRNPKASKKTNKKPKQGSYGSMEQFVFRVNKN